MILRNILQEQIRLELRMDTRKRLKCVDLGIAGEALVASHEQPQHHQHHGEGERVDFLPRMSVRRVQRPNL